MRSGRKRELVKRDRGDTLIEVLVAVTIIGLAVTGLIGGLAATIGSSGTHRNLATLDGIVQTFGEMARQDIQLKPQTGITSSAEPEFQSCATSYVVASPPYPESGPAGTTVTAFVSGETGTPTVTVGGVNATLVSVEQGTGSYATYENESVTFSVNGTTSGAVVLTYGSGSVTLPVNFTAATSVPTGYNPLPSTIVGITGIKYWNDSTFGSACAPTDGMSADLQELTIGAYESGASDSMNLVVTNPAATKAYQLGSETMTVSAPSVSYGSNLIFTATISGPSSWSAPTGSVSWVITDSTFATKYGTCTSTVTAGSATCTLTKPDVRTYVATASYSGDSNYSPLVANGSGVVSAATPTFTWNVTNVANMLTFTVTIGGSGGAPPDGTVTWPDNNCSVTVAYVPATGTASCEVTSPAAGTYSETADYTPGSSGDYASGTSTSPSTTVTGPTVTVSYEPSGSNALLTATVTAPSGSITPFSSSDSFTWGGVTCSSTGAFTPQVTTPPSPPSATQTCTVTPSTSATTWNVTARFNGDTTYAAKTGPSPALAVYVPTVGKPLVTSGSGTSSETFTATVSGPSTATNPPGGSISWSVASVSGSAETVVASGIAPLSGTGTTSTASFTANSLSTSKNVKYDVTVTYDGDASSSYTPGNPDAVTSKNVGG